LTSPAAAAHSVAPTSASNPTVTAKAARRKAARATEKKRQMRHRIESWAKQQNDKPSRSEAIRRLIEFALAAKVKRQNTGDN